MTSAGASLEHPAGCPVLGRARPAPANGRGDHVRLWMRPGHDRPSEVETFWTEYLRFLARRGVERQLVISDAHEGTHGAPCAKRECGTVRLQLTAIVALDGQSVGSRLGASKSTGSTY
jgi:hypothetical protein